MSYIEGTATITLNQYEIFKKKQKQYWGLLEERDELIELIRVMEDELEHYSCNILLMAEIKSLLKEYPQGGKNNGYTSRHSYNITKRI